MHRRWKVMQRKWNCKTKHHVCLPNTSFCRLSVCQFVMQCNLIWKTYSFIFDKSERNRAAINGGADFNRVIRNHAMTLNKMKFPDRQAHLNQSGINERRLWFEISLCMSAFLDYRWPLTNLQRRMEKKYGLFYRLTISPLCELRALNWSCCIDLKWVLWAGLSENINKLIDAHL